MGGSFVPRSPQNRDLATGETVGQMAGYGAECEGTDGSPSTGSLDSPTEYHHRKEEEQRSRQEQEREREVEVEVEVESAANSSLEMSMQDMDILREPSRTGSSRVDLRIQPYGHEVDGRFDDDDAASTPRSVFEDDDDDDYIVEDEDEEDEDEEDEEELEEDEHDDEPGSSGHTSLWDDAQRNDETVVYLGQRKSIESTKPTLEFVEEELQGCSSFADGHSQQGQPDADEEDYEDEDEDDYEETARLAYLGDPENDTLNSLYEVYSDIGSEAEDENRDLDVDEDEDMNVEAETETRDPDRPYTPAGIPLPSPTHSEVHAYALLSLFDRHKSEERRVTPGDAWAYEPDDSFRSSSGASLRRLFGARDSLSSGSYSSPVPIPFLRERVFTPPPPTPPPGEVPPLPPSRVSAVFFSVGRGDSFVGRSDTAITETKPSNSFSSSPPFALFSAGRGASFDDRGDTTTMETKSTRLSPSFPPFTLLPARRGGSLDSRATTESKSSSFFLSPFVTLLSAGDVSCI
ncbi:hypothetical protein AAF712_012587 [Marasmius tenuissimus]|uniref:Uncharacterized protein n=1 Tax=Marasmius tenuissimus TaxID=585030 RepID=A0ABR2ZI75_9AGAR